MKKVFIVILDYLYLFFCQILSLFYPHAPLSYQKKEDPMGTIVLIPGIYEKWTFMKSLGDALSNAGYSVYTVDELGYNTITIKKAADIVSEFLEKHHLKDVVILGHSKGGLIGKWLLLNSEVKHNIKKVIAISTPFSGTHINKFYFYLNLAEVAPSSEVIKELERHDEVNHKITSIAPSFDEHVLSPNGSYLKDAKNIKLKVAGHHRILFSRELRKTIFDLLN